MDLIIATGNPLEFLDGFGIEWELLLSQALSFGIVAVALYWFVFKPVIKVSDSRREEIARGLADAEEAKKRLVEAENTAKEEISRAAREASETLSKAREDAKKAMEQASKEAREKAEEIRAKSEEQARLDIERLRGELRSELSELVKEAAIAVVGEVLTEEQKSKLSEMAAKKLK